MTEQQEQINSNNDSRKLDRQLRLWKRHGQDRLTASHLCLLGATATGTETLKNLILPGCGEFTIVDDGLVSPADLGVSFFLDPPSLGQGRADTAVRLLQELNPSVRGHAIATSPAALIQEACGGGAGTSSTSGTSTATACVTPTSLIEGNFFASFTMVIATSLLDQDTLLLLSDILWSLKIPLLVAESYGFYGYCRIAVPEHCIVERHQLDAAADLRLDAPFPGLRQYVERIESTLKTMDSMQLSHVTYVILLLHAIKSWKLNHDGQVPKTTAEKVAFKQSLRDLMPNCNDPENVEEAISFAYRVWTPTRIPDEVGRLLSDPKATLAGLGSDPSPFWIMVAALRLFVERSDEGSGTLPLSGAIPDMKADTQSYIALQKVYQAKAVHDYNCFKQHVLEILNVVQRPAIPEDELRRFCKNARDLQVIHYRSLRQEYSIEVQRDQHMAYLNGSDANYFHVYLLRRAMCIFFKSHKRFPQAHRLEDEESFRGIVGELVQHCCPGKCSIDERHLISMLQTGGRELHTVSALMGGIVAQEAIKLITGQYVPLQNTLIFDGIASGTAVFSL